MPHQVRAWRRSLDLSDTDLKRPLEKEILATAHDRLGDFRSKNFVPEWGIWGRKRSNRFAELTNPRVRSNGSVRTSLSRSPGPIALSNPACRESYGS